MIDVYSVRKHTELEKNTGQSLWYLNKEQLIMESEMEGKSINMCSMHVDGEMIFLNAMSMFWISIRLFIGF